MTRHAFRKMTRQDFSSRVARIDPEYASIKIAADARPARPFMALMMGFGWGYLCLAVARNRDFIEQSLLQGTLSQAHRDHVFHALAALLAVSAVMLVVHFLRFTFTPKHSATRGNSGGLLLGAMMAAGVVHTPPGVMEAAFGLLDDNSRSLIIAASEAVPAELRAVDFVSSAGGL